MLNYMPMFGPVPKYIDLCKWQFPTLKLPPRRDLGVSENMVALNHPKSTALSLYPNFPSTSHT